MNAIAGHDVGMKQGLKLKIDFREKPRPVPVPALLVELEPWHRAFAGNLRERLWPRRRAPLLLSSQPAPYWQDVFVRSHVPWGRFAESAVFHIAAIAVLWSSPYWWPRQPQLTAPAVFHSSDVVYYDASEYLPPLDTGGRKAEVQKKGEPAFAPQPIISVPPEPDNRRQTIVAPPNLKLNHDVPLPNVVAWANTATPIPPTAKVSQPLTARVPALPLAVIQPAPEVDRSRLSRTPTLLPSVVAPAPQLESGLSQRGMQMGQPTVVEPPPAVATTSARRPGDINIGHAPVVAPAPLLPMSEQRTLPSMAEGGSGLAAAPPPPSVGGTGGTGLDGRLIALGVNPAPPSTAIETPGGNRRGTFAATPEGKPGASGTPDVSAGGSHGTSGNSAQGKGPGSDSGTNPFALPSGLYVGPGSRPSNSSVAGNGGGSTAGDPQLVASAAPPRIGSTPRRAAAEMPPDLKTPEEKNLFGVRRFYAMTLNVPNLNSAGGSWIMHFAEMKEAEKGELLSPVATQAVDPGYPLELMKQNVHGTVTLSAVIQSDGSVGQVQIINGIDDQLDEYARKALLRWKFLPALRNGSPVALQAVVMIPFRSMHKKNGF